MKTIETDRARIDLTVSSDIAPGRHRALVVLDERPVSIPRSSLADFPVHDLGPWPEKLSLRRVDLYGDGER
jgi:hypothetical protein